MVALLDGPLVLLGFVELAGHAEDVVAFEEDDGEDYDLEEGVEGDEAPHLWGYYVLVAAVGHAQEEVVAGGLGGEGEGG